MSCAPIGEFLAALYATFIAEEAMLVEVNPLVVTPEREVRALDAKVTLDDNAMYRHPDNASLRDLSSEDPQERMAKERHLTYVKLDGDIGVLGNGAGLVMSTLDVVAQHGGAPANFLDAGGGARADAVTAAVEVILSNPKVKAVLFNIFGGITRCDEVARGLIEAFEQIEPQVPFVVRLDGTNAPEGRTPARGGEPPERVCRRDDGRGGRARRGARPVSVIVGTQTRLCVSGITGREGSFHTLNNRAYGTQVVAGVTPGKGGLDLEGIPVFNTFREAVAASEREHGDGVRPAGVRGGFDPRGRRRRDRDDHRDHRRDPRPRRAARLHAAATRRRRPPDRAELPGRALARQGERRHHPRGLLP